MLVDKFNGKVNSRVKSNRFNSNKFISSFSSNLSKLALFSRLSHFDH